MLQSKRDNEGNVVSSSDSDDVDVKHTVTTFEVLDWSDVPESVRHHFRKRGKGPSTPFQSTSKSGFDKKKTTCMLYLQADHLFYEKMGSEEATIDVMTRHVQRVNSIYKEIGKSFYIPG